VNPSTRNLIVGLFTAIGIIALAVGILVTGKKTGFLIPTYTLIAEFPSVQGLTTGSPVWLHGVQVGFVKRVSFSDITEKKVRVELSIERRYQELIREDSLAMTTTKGLLGDQLVEITIGSPSYPVLADGSTIPTRPAPDFSALLKGVSQAVLTLGDFVNTLKVTAEKLEKGGGTLGRFLTDDRLYRELLSVVTELKKTTEELNRGKGTLGRLLTDPTLSRELEGLLKDLRGGEGSLQLLMKDPALYQELLSTTTQLRQLVQHIERGEGSVGRAIREEELYRNLNDLILEVKKLTEDIRKNPSRYFKIEIF